MVRAAALERFFDSPTNYAHTANVAGLVLERLPNGEHAWLRPADQAWVESTDAAEDCDARYWITPAGRCALREAGE